jgi:predicted DNA-binding protein (MmcQ/YjbR family)
MADVRGQLREFALSLPDASEDFPWGERVAKVNGKVFVFLGHDDESGPPGMTVKLVESRGHALALEGTEPTGYGLGRAGWVNVPLDAEGVSLDLLRDWIEESYRIVAPKRLVAELDAATAAAINSCNGVPTNVRIPPEPSS